MLAGCKALPDLGQGWRNRAQTNGNRDGVFRDRLRNFHCANASKSMSSVSGRQDDLAAAAVPLAPPQVQPTTPLPARGDDAELFRRAQSGDRSAFGQIVQLYQDRVYNAVLRMVGDLDDARDLTQETFTRALVKIDTFRGEAQPYTWLFRIALNLS